MTVTFYRVCAVAECDRRQHARSLCKTHYNRELRDRPFPPLPVPYAAGNDEAFWSRVEKSDGCWEWTGSKTAQGYGNVRLPTGTNGYAHRVAYTLAIGEIPAGKVLDHLCRNRSCVRPDHLEPVSQRENVLRGASAYGPLKTACPHGHDMTDATNVYARPDGSKVCRSCARAQNDQRRMARQKARSQ